MQNKHIGKSSQRLGPQCLWQCFFLESLPCNVYYSSSKTMSLCSTLSRDFLLNLTVSSRCSKTCQCVILCPGMSRSISSSSSKTYSIATSSLCTCGTIMANEKLCLKWNDFQHLVQISFGELRISNDFSDVTLVCEGQSLQAHKVILSARSPFFKGLLRAQPRQQQPLIFMRGVKFLDLAAILDFMYQDTMSLSRTLRI